MIVNVNQSIMHEKQKETNLVQTWYRKRKILLYLGYIQQGFSFLEISAVSISALKYYKEVIHVQNPDYYYGFCMSSLFLSAIIATKLCGIYMDKTRNIRMCSNLLWFATIGNILYSLPFSEWLPIIGRFVSGFNEGLKVAIIGEKIIIINGAMIGRNTLEA